MLKGLEGRKQIKTCSSKRIDTLMSPKIQKYFSDMFV